jgi:hypothetical protein
MAGKSRQQFFSRRPMLTEGAAAATYQNAVIHKPGQGERPAMQGEVDRRRLPAVLADGPCFG